MKFTKKPVTIEAIQWTGKLECLDPFSIPELHQSLGSSQVGIPTLEGTMIASVGDWIIKGVKGEFYPCKPDIFDLTYGPEAPTIAPDTGQSLGVAIMALKPGDDIPKNPAGELGYRLGFKAAKRAAARLACCECKPVAPDTGELAKLREALDKINAIRNSIIGFQTVGWSDHVYPLVAALDEAGIVGAGYEKARKSVQARLDVDNANERDAARYRWLLDNYARGDGYHDIDAALNDGEPEKYLSPAIDAQIAALAPIAQQKEQENG